ncbi:MAG: tetratricopeptide repeat protein [Verrucomicrobia bacterium]|nr:tetratricopeptide repeat protein [Verrucomicrobiota bacterium]
MTKEKSNDEIFANLRVFMERSMGGAVAKTGSQKEYEAQDLYYEAMEKGDDDLIFQALEIDPGNVDCLLQLLYMFDASDGEALEFSRHIVETAEERLGKEMFEECKGYFWGMLETRPYMRARNDLAIRLSDAGKIEEAIVEYEGMLELCPGDNLGIRYVLLGLYFQESRTADAERLLKEFEDERPYSAVMAWGYVLERYLVGELDEAKKALKVARKTNGYAEAYLKGHRKLPKNSPGSYSPGSREEAQVCAECQQEAWSNYPLAQVWLEAQAKK